MSHQQPTPPAHLLRTQSSSFKPLADDQRLVEGEHFDGPGVTLTRAGSGTGKTTTGIEIFVDAIFEELEQNPDTNPFKQVLSTSFTVDAARQLKTKVKRRCRDHIDELEANGNPAGDPIYEHWGDIQRWIETDSHIQTLDSFAQESLREVADEMGLNPAFEVAGGPKYADIVDGILVELRDDPNYKAEIRTLETAYPGGDHSDSWAVMISNAQQKCRELGMTPQQAAQDIRDNMEDLFNRRRPTSVSDVAQFGSEFLDTRFTQQELGEVIQQNPQEWVAYAQALYSHSTEVADAFSKVLEEYAVLYADRTEEEALFTHTDITYYFWKYLSSQQYASKLRSLYRDTLENRFRHILVDEVQDTSFTQMEILSYLIPHTPTDTHVLCIGDLKQAIYAWRSAEPELFANLLDSAQKDTQNLLNVDPQYLRVRELTENFRSEPSLVDSQNHLFTNLFHETSTGRGQIGSFDIEYNPLDARRQANPADATTIHTFDMNDINFDEVPNGHQLPGETRRDTWMRLEANRVAARIQDILTNNPLFIDQDRHIDSSSTQLSNASQMREARPGDFAALFRSKTKMNEYSRALSEYGIKHAQIGGASLLEQPEVELLVDALKWMSHPDSLHHMHDVVTSPLYPLGDDALQRLAANHFDLEATIGTLPTSFPVEQREQLVELQTLVHEIGWARNRRKSRVLQSFIRRSGIDAAVLADQEGLQRYANIREFIAIIDSWEEDDVITFTNCLSRIELLNADYIDEPPRMAAIADMESDDTVKLLSVHASKGLEFPVVIMGDTFNSSNFRAVYDDELVMDRHGGFALRPYAGDAEQPDLRVFKQRFDINGLYDPRPDNERDYDDFDRGLLWLSENRRRKDGELMFEHPFKHAVRNERAEDWRCYYVSYTRACDHVVFPRLSDSNTPWYRKWNSYIAATCSHLHIDGNNITSVPGFNSQTRTHNVPLTDEKGNQRNITIGFDDLGEASAPMPTQHDPATLLGNVQSTISPSTPPHTLRLRTVTPSSVQTVWTDTTNYQHTTLLGLDTGHTATRSGTAPPNITASIWGEIVHDSIEHINDEQYSKTTITSPSQALVDTTDDILNSYLDGANQQTLATAQTKLRGTALTQYADTDTYEEIRDAQKVFTEYPMLAAVNHIMLFFIDGRIDTLYQTQDGDWKLADLKTGTPVAAGTPQHEKYKWQLNVYVWMLEEVYDITIAEARLVYVYPTPQETAITLNRSRTNQRLDDLTQKLEIDSDGALSRIP